MLPLVVSLFALELCGLCTNTLSPVSAVEMGALVEGWGTFTGTFFTKKMKPNLVPDH